ncbi:MAG: TlpA family protein disulfide reductase [Cellulomonas sp.]
MNRRAISAPRVSHAARVAGSLVALALGAGLLAGCTTTSKTPAGTTTDIANQGYQSGDGSTRKWAVADRSGPVALAGTDFTGTAQDVTMWRGDVVVLNSWYAACPPCRAEAPGLVAFATDYTTRGVHVLGINGTDDVGAAQAFERTFTIPYPSLADTGGHAIAALQGAVPVQAVPTTVVLDREGRVAARILGLADPSTLRGLVDDILAEPVDPAAPAASPTSGATGATATP